MNASIIRRIEKGLAGAGLLCGRTGIWRDPGRYEKGQDKNYCTHVLSTFERIMNMVHSEYNTGSPGRAGPKCGRHVLLVSEWSPCAPEIVAGRRSCGLSPILPAIRKRSSGSGTQLPIGGRPLHRTIATESQAGGYLRWRKSIFVLPYRRISRFRMVWQEVILGHVREAD